MGSELDRPRASLQCLACIHPIQDLAEQFAI